MTYGRFPALRCRTWLTHDLPCRALPCPAVPCRALPCPGLHMALPCRALPCPALPWLTHFLTLPYGRFPVVRCLILPWLTLAYDVLRYDRLPAVRGQFISCRSLPYEGWLFPAVACRRDYMPQGGKLTYGRFLVYNAVPCRTMPYPVVRWLTLSQTLPYHAVPCLTHGLALPCLAVPCLALPYTWP